ncbi:hypothetical protein Pse7367_2898 [Thalassoporum mexicanum PCC 7367]|uniref:CPP1-like family protein n=1 Tax=Thalassoporum mexicanum TaxID=3457544 RepID=UPI00029FE89B|nr:CPP1-like family protein [Pseudanabaena sp. PCC 7367]AFY71151.1 hypothetical protein Pse7367_2898 [Pseudanabaena sp. PCC 7367]
MSETTPYEKLGINEDASFEEVRDARDRLMNTLKGDEQQQEAIEAAYDAVLMDRLRARQAGTLKVPDRIRFPEKVATETLSKPTVAQTTASAPNWLVNSLDTPNNQEILTCSGVFAGLGILSIWRPDVAPTWLALAWMASIFFLTRKERKFWRSVTISFIAICVATLLGLLIEQMPAFMSETFPGPIAMAFMLVVIWLVSCFVR